MDIARGVDYILDGMRHIVRNILYAIIPAAAISILLANIFFGHLLFAPDSDQVANKYSIYVHLQPEWDSHPKNLLFDVTNSWYRPDSGTDEQANATYNENRLLSIGGKSYVELRHNFSDCRDDWTPILYRRAVDTVRHEIEYLRGSELSADPDISVYPDVANPAYDAESQRQIIRDGFVQFIPICTSAENTSYDYSIRSDNRDVGFDVYFVPSERQAHAFYESGFAPYENPGCSARNMQSFSGTCENVGPGSGLLVAVPDRLDPWVTKITVNLYEQ